ncbi:MAG TPA: maleylacetoacetate isomerase [Nevskiaceae bacterium]
MDLYSFHASSTSWRVRIALQLKGVAFTTIAVNLRTMEQRLPQYMAKNPAASVPMLDDAGVRVTQSLAIIEYLDKKFPAPRLVPTESSARIRVMEIANLIANDIQPLNGMRVMRFLENDLHVSKAQQQMWYSRWIDEGFRPLEKLLERAGSDGFCTGCDPTLADCCLVPQVSNAVQHGCPMDAYPRIRAVYAHCSALPAFRRAAPDQQPDYPN